MKWQLQLGESMKIVLWILLPLSGLLLGWFSRWLYAKKSRSVLEQDAKSIIESAHKTAEQTKKEMLNKAQEQVLQERKQLDREIREQRGDLQRYDRRLQQKEDSLESKAAQQEERQKKLTDLENTLKSREAEIEGAEASFQLELEKIADISKDEAKTLILKNVEQEARSEAYSLVTKIEREAVETAEKKSRKVVLDTIQRIAMDATSDAVVTSVELPNDEMKGRIIGREGRNIRTLETLTGADVIIDDTPEAVVISSFDPIRRAVAVKSLQYLVMDGRIHPARIEEIVKKVGREIDNSVEEAGEKILYELGIHNIRQEGIRALGRLHYRTSYGQNVLEHSKEVALIAAILASELGLNPDTARRAGLLHDIGKGMTSDTDVNHAEAGAELARRMGESKAVVQAIALHHSTVEGKHPECAIIKVADAISAARPGARRESFESYIKKLDNLERIAMDFDGVEKVFAVQAGRELRIMVNNEMIEDAMARDLARNIAHRIETELKYPGRIRVTVIRETRVVEYAS